MRLNVTRLIVLLLLGAIINVAVAWVCTQSAMNPSTERPIDDGDRRVWRSRMRSGWPSEPQSHIMSFGRGTTYESWATIVYFGPEAPAEAGSTDSQLPRGWRESNPTMTSRPDRRLVASCCTSADRPVPPRLSTCACALPELVGLALPWAGYTPAFRVTQNGAASTKPLIEQFFELGASKRLQRHAAEGVLGHANPP